MNSDVKRTETVFRACAAVFLSLSVSSLASSTDGPISAGDYIVIYAQITDCPEFPGIIEARKVDDSDQLFLNVGPIETIGRTLAEFSQTSARPDYSTKD